MPVARLEGGGYGLAHPLVAWPPGPMVEMAEEARSVSLRISGRSVPLMLIGARGPHPAAEQKSGRDGVSVRFADPRPSATYLLGSIGPRTFSLIETAPSRILAERLQDSAPRDEREIQRGPG
jgi:hypothetical protein